MATDRGEEDGGRTEGSAGRYADGGAAAALVSVCVRGRGAGVVYGGGLRLYGGAVWGVASPVVREVPSAALRRAVMGVAMGVTAVMIIHSRMGKRSGAHFNPAITLTYLRLGKIGVWDAWGMWWGSLWGGVLGWGWWR